MFTGIVQSIGIVQQVRRMDADMSMVVDPQGIDAHIEIGDSVSVNGVCLTVAERLGSQLRFDLSVETLSRTLLGDLKIGAPVNLELALLPATRIGGHFVTGHVDGVGELVAQDPEGRSIKMQFSVPEGLSRYVAEKGSICIDGASLTVNNVDGNRFHINIVPHTARKTIMRYYRPGRKVHIEVDILARYVERFMTGERESTDDSSITAEFLAEHGFLPPCEE
ncbi:MAG: riboflavin synthase [Gammaproteobacteria bacterium]|nr:riboflavin synthase [Gammaproteobacteria bacterium]